MKTAEEVYKAVRIKKHIERFGGTLVLNSNYSFIPSEIIIESMEEYASQFREKEIRSDRMIADLEHEKAVLKSELKQQTEQMQFYHNRYKEQLDINVSQRVPPPTPE